MANHRGFHASSGRQRRRVYIYLFAYHQRPEGRDLLREWRRRRAGFGVVLVSMPGAGNASVDDLALAQRSVLVLADVRNGGNPAVVLEDGDPLAPTGKHGRAFLRNGGRRADRDKSIRFRTPRPVQSPLLQARLKMQRD